MRTSDAIGMQAAEVRGWRALGTWPAAERPSAPWAWLAHDGSLTQKLRDFAGTAFHVRVLRETGGVLAAEDARLLGLRASEPARLREVYLCGLRPLVFGRTLAAGDGAAHWLERLGAQPLGERVFAEPSTLRGDIQVMQLAADDALCRDAWRGMDMPAAPLWARRSVLRVRETNLLIYECFLPGVDA